MIVYSNVEWRGTDSYVEVGTEFTVDFIEAVFLMV